MGSAKCSVKEAGCRNDPTGEIRSLHAGTSRILKSLGAQNAPDSTQCSLTRYRATRSSCVYLWARL